MAALALAEQALVSGMGTLSLARHTLIAAYTFCVYDWIISLDQEIALIYPAQWNVVKAAYMFCRCYPIAVAPFHLWGLIGDHDQHVCESRYRILFVIAMPSMLSSQFILMLRTYAFSGRKKAVLALLLITFSTLVGAIIWVASREITLTPIFKLVNRSGCFAVSDLPSGAAEAKLLMGDGTGKIGVPIGYHLGLISVLTTVFDCLNMFTVFWIFYQRGRLGPLGQSFLRQGLLVYVVMTVLNALTIGTFFNFFLVRHGIGAISSFVYLLPSPLACRLVLMLRRTASPTQTELRLEHSQMINEALELIGSESHSKGTSDTYTLQDLHPRAQP